MKVQVCRGTTSIEYEYSCFWFVLLQERSFILLLLNCPTTKNATEVGFHGLRAARVERQAI